MDIKSISVNDLVKDNKRLCLSTLRVFGKCDKCPQMVAYFKGLTKNPCESAIITKERQEVINKIEQIKKELSKAELKIKEQQDILN